jgi:hypothetical protein
MQAIRVLTLVLLAFCSVVARPDYNRQREWNGDRSNGKAVVPNAKVTAANVDTGIETAHRTTRVSYNIPFLQIGNA